MSCRQRTSPVIGDLRDVRAVLPLLGLRRALLARAVALGSLTLAASVALAGVSAWLIVRASQMPPVMFLNVAAVGVRTFGILRGVSRYLERLASHDVALQGVVSLRTALVERLAAGRSESVAGLRRGDLLARTGVDVDDVGDVVVRGLVPGAVAAVVSVGSVAAIAFFSVPSALVLALCVALSGLAVPALAARADAAAEQDRLEARAAIATATESLLTRAADLALSGRRSAELATLEAAQRRAADAERRAARPLAASAALAVLTTGASVVGALLVAIPAAVSGTLTATELGVVVLLPLAAFEATAALPAAVTQLHRSAAAARRITALLAESSDAADQPDAVPAGAATGLVATGLTCAWPGQPGVVSDLDLAVPPGTSLAVVGPSGSGKTTLLLTLAGMLAPTGGTVCLDGGDPSRLRGTERSDHVALTLEDAHVFTTTVAENLRAARGDMTEPEAWEALRLAGLEDWVRSLPQGLGTPISPDDVSGGERRRLLVARALVSRAPLLLLDEPGEHLPSEVADALVADLLGLTAHGRSVVVVTHHTGAVGRADAVLELEASS